MTLRYELKFLTGMRDAEAAMRRLYAASGVFFEEYPQRQVHSIYFDTPHLETYVDHVNGLNARAKVRLRWYGNLLPQGAVVLEVKRREGALIRKIGWPAVLTALDRASLQQCLAAVAETMGAEAHRLRLGDLAPVLRVSYERRYFVTARGVRATLDDALRVAPTDDAPADTSVPVDQSVLCELKFPVAASVAAQAAAATLDWPRVRHSKYVNAIKSSGFA